MLGTKLTSEGGSFDWKRFFRLEISGYICLLYTLLFTVCLFVLFGQESRLSELDPGFWYKGPFAAIPIALVLGFIIHQISIRVFNPFCEYRTFYGERTVLRALKARAKADGLTIGGADMNGIFDALAGLPSRRNVGYTEYLRSEISRRYSFYYARLDAGLLAPVLGLVLSFFIYAFMFLLYGFGNNGLATDGTPLRWLIPLGALLFTVSISIGNISYCGKLVREINVLECTLLAENEDAIFDLVSKVSPCYSLQSSKRIAKRRIRRPYSRGLLNRLIRRIVREEIRKLRPPRVSKEPDRSVGKKVS